MTIRYRITGNAHSLDDVAKELKKQQKQTAEIFVIPVKFIKDRFEPGLTFMRVSVIYDEGKDPFVIDQTPYNIFGITREDSGRILELEATVNRMLIKAVGAADFFEGRNIITNINGKPSEVTRIALGIVRPGIERR